MYGVIIATIVVFAGLLIAVSIPDFQRMGKPKCWKCRHCLDRTSKRKDNGRLLFENRCDFEKSQFFTQNCWCDKFERTGGGTGHDE